MSSLGQGSLESLCLLLLLFVAIFAGFAKMLKVPYPILLVVAGVLLSFLPGMPRFSFPPDLVFLVFLPPLLYSAAWVLSWREFQRSFARISMLAVGLVLATIIAFVLGAGTLLPGFDAKSALLLGAVVAATDAIAATSIARRIGLPHSVAALLEAESLINDGTGLLALQFGLIILAVGRTPSVVDAVGHLVFLTAGGVAIGLLIGVVVAWFERLIDDGPIEIVISILVPYAAYLSGEQAHVSGVLAVISCGMYMSRRSHTFMSPQVRLQSTAVWDALTFVLNGVVFVLLGLQMPYVLGEIHGYSFHSLLVYGAAFSLAMIALRMAWVFLESYASLAFQRWFLHLELEKPDVRHLVVIGWGGMRGVLSLAAAVSLPLSTPNGPLQQRSLIIFLAFCLIFSTLVLQGLTFPLLIRSLGLAGHAQLQIEEQEARRTLLREALVHLGRRRSKERYHSMMLGELMIDYQRRLDALPQEYNSAEPRIRDAQKRREAIIDVLQIERAALIRLRDEEQIDDEVLRTLQRELDITESRVHTFTA